MASFGERLKRERELRRISLDEISQATKIGTRSLRALEEQEFEKLPGGIFNKGFVRSYARFLGIDEEQAVADYEAAAHEKLSIKGSKPFPGASGDDEQEEMAGDDEAPGNKSRRAGTFALILAAVACVLAYFAWKQYSQPPSSAVQPVSAPVEPVSAPPLPETAAESNESPVSAEGPNPSLDEALLPKESTQPAPDSSPPPSVAQPQAQEFEVRIQAQQDSWMSIVADGQTVMSDTLRAPSEKTVRAQREITLRIGNAGGVTIYHNGTQLPPLGEVNRTATLTVTTEGPQR